MRGRTRSIAALSLVLAGAPAGAVTIPFTEDFATGVAGWEDNANNALTWVASGGPDGSSHASGGFDFTGFVAPFPGAGPIVFRAQDEDNASGGAFIGDWLAAGVQQVRAFVRHDAPVDLTWILRIATSSNFPGAAFTPSGTTVSADTWTELVFDIDPSSPDCTAESFDPSFTCADALQTVGHFQLGTDAPQSLIDDGVAVTFGVDKVSLVPEPAALALLAPGLLGLAAAGRRRS